MKNPISRFMKEITWVHMDKPTKKNMMETTKVNHILYGLSFLNSSVRALITVSSIQN